MDFLSLYIALTPLAIYFLVMGLVNLSRRPFLVSGVRDLGILCLAMSGFMIIGPMELFFPENAAWRFGPYVWILVLMIYMLVVVLVLLSQPPRIHIYNITLTDLRPILSDLAMEMDPQSRWAGDALAMPSLGVQLYLEQSSFTKTVSLIGSRKVQNIDGWRVLENGLRRSLRRFSSPYRHYAGLVFFLGGLLLLTLLHSLLWWNPEAFLAAIPDKLRF